MTWRTEWWKSLLQNRIQKKKKKRNKDSLRDLWDNTECTNICRRNREREKTEKTLFRDNSGKPPEHGKGNSQPSPESTESHRNEKPKEEYSKTHSNQTEKN